MGTDFGKIQHPTFNLEHPLGDRLKAGLQAERLVIETLRVNAERFKAGLFEQFCWPFAQIMEDSPLLVAERDAEDQFRI